MLEFYVKINKIPEFNIARKIPEFYVIIARRKYFPDFFMGGGHLSHVSYGYVVNTADADGLLLRMRLRAS